MGKSAGKWIKTVLFGKKYSKSDLSKNVTSKKKNAAETQVEDLAGNSCVISELCELTERGTQNSELEKGISGSPCDAISVIHADQGVDSQSNDVLVLLNEDEMRRIDKAATKAQAAFRGYLARRAFRALKGIIRLQALIRGHLIRRQAVATLRCMHAIVKFQALARGGKARRLDARPEVRKNFNMGGLQDIRRVASGEHLNSFLGSEMLATHPFIRKLIVTLPSTIPLSLQYDLAEPNSAWTWLERWSLSHFWKPPAHTKKVMKAKPQRKQGSTQIVERDAGKSKRTMWKASTTAHGENGSLTCNEIDKPKRNPRKVTTNQTEVVQEQPVSELERVKCNLRKASASAVAAPEKSEPETEKLQPLQRMEIFMSASPTNVSEQEIVASSENAVDSDVVVDKLDSIKASSKMTKDEPVDMQHDNHPAAVETNSLETDAKMESAVFLDDKLSCKEEHSRKENHKIRKRRSLPAKPEYPQNISQNFSRLPSYMVATESAKAKLRAQGYPKFGEDEADYGNSRRHSLPVSTNGKLSSLSPRIEKPMQANGKGGSKINKSLTSSRHDKAVQPGWRR